MEYEIVNARITGTFLGYGRGCFTSDITLDFGGSVQSFGGWVIRDEWCYKWVAGILKALELEDDHKGWEKLKGTVVRVKREKLHSGKIVAIGHIINDTWFNPREDLGFK